MHISSHVPPICCYFSYLWFTYIYDHRKYKSPSYQTIRIRSLSYVINWQLFFFAQRHCLRVTMRQREKQVMFFFAPLQHLVIICPQLTSCRGEDTFHSGRRRLPFCLINFQTPSSLVCKCYWVCLVTTIHSACCSHRGVICCGWHKCVAHLQSCNDDHQQ